jgi:hypothetical protein
LRPMAARRMGGAKRYPSIVICENDGLRKGSTHPTNSTSSESATPSLRMSQNRLQQSWKPRIDIRFADNVAVFDAFFRGLDQSGLAQNAKMVRQRRFGHVGARRGCGAGHAVVVLEQAFDDAQPHRVGERCQHAGQCDVLTLRVNELHHAEIYSAPLERVQ